MKELLCIVGILISHSFAYNYLNGGEDWTEGDCANGTEQTPINFNTRTTVSSNVKVDIVFSTNITSETQKLEDTYKVNGNWSTLSLTINGTLYKFDCIQFHFHVPSEHTINGDYYDGEIHFVHTLREENNTQNITRKIAVLGVFLQINETYGNNTFFEEYDPTETGEFELDLKEAIGDQIVELKTYYFYEGGLTTPDCAEIVNWFVMDEPIQVSKEQMIKLQNAWANNASFAGGNGNNRVTMPLNGRLVMQGKLFANRIIFRLILFFLFLLI